MALPLFTTPFSSLCSSPSSSTSAPTTNILIRLSNIPIVLKPKSYTESRIGTPLLLKNRGTPIVKASADVDGAGSSIPESPATPTESNDKSVSVENLPLESKLQLNLEQKMRMKVDKKIRLRRKRLVRKRHLRKKGRWPPSKLKKNKNI